MITTAQVAVASITQESLTEATKLGVVPYGVGRLTLRRKSKASGTAKATEHYSGGQSRTSRLDVRRGVIEMPLRVRGENGSPLEWIEVNFE